MHEYGSLPSGLSIAYVAYWILCGAYTVYVLAACLVSPPFRDRVHRGSWLHVVEAWMLIAALWAGWGWARHILTAADQRWSGSPPVPVDVRVAAAALFVLQPVVWLGIVVMAAITIVHAWPRRPKAALGAPRAG